MRCDLSQLLLQKITKCIHSSKPASLNRPIATLGDAGVGGVGVGDGGGVDSVKTVATLKGGGRQC